MLTLREHTFLGMTQSLCPICLDVVPAKIICRRGRVFFRKRCPTHGTRDDFVCSDVNWFDKGNYQIPGKLPLQFGVRPERGCPYDCGLCTEHEQHTCIALLEITDSCNLTCPMCFAESAPGRTHVCVDQCKRAIDRLVRVEGRPEVLQLSGGEPTIHPQFLDLLAYACEQPIDVVMINTNGVRLANDASFVDSIATHRHRVEIYLQFDGFEAEQHQQLRGKPLLDVKLRAIEALAQAGLKCTLVSTLQRGVNEDQVGTLIRFAASQPHVTGVSFQPATYVGRYFLPDQLDQRITFPDVIKAAEQQTGGMFSAADFLPLPCAHPNAHSLAYAFRQENQLVPLNRFLDIEQNMDLLANGIVFTRERAKGIIDQVLSRSCSGSSGCCGTDVSDGATGAIRQGGDSLEQGVHLIGDAVTASPTIERRAAERFFAKAISGELQQSDLLRVTITSFMDAYNFDLRQLMKSCVHHLLPSGHLIPFSAYNVLYRNGHVPLPPIDQADSTPSSQKDTSLPLVSIDGS